MLSFLNDTAIGKSVKVLIYVAVSGAVTALIAFLADNPDLFNPYVVGLVNIVLVALRNFVNPKVNNI
jgi:hypothetical protein